MIKPLRQIPYDQPATIAAITAAGELGRRLRDMGLTPGTAVTVIGKAPLNDPVAVRLKDSILTLRNGEADHITVELEGMAK